MECKNKLNN